TLRDDVLDPANRKTKLAKKGDVLDRELVETLVKAKAGDIPIKAWVSDEVQFLSADEEDRFIVAQANAPLDPERHFTEERTTAPPPADSPAAKLDSFKRELGILLKPDDGSAEQWYPVHKFERSNQGTCLSQRVIVKAGAHVEAGTALADGPATSEGELALGRNILVAFMPWEGYNYEDAILISESVVREDKYTSIHIEEYEIEARDT